MPPSFHRNAQTGFTSPALGLTYFKSRAFRDWEGGLRLWNSAIASFRQKLVDNYQPHLRPPTVDASDPVAIQPQDTDPLA